MQLRKRRYFVLHAYLLLGNFWGSTRKRVFRQLCISFVTLSAVIILEIFLLSSPLPLSSSPPLSKRVVGSTEQSTIEADAVK
jgi:hypothetical protein